MLQSVSWSSLGVALILLVFSVAAGAVYFGVLVRRGWDSWATLGASIALAAALAVTLVPSEFGEESVVRCVIAIPTTLGLFDLPAITQESLNALLLLPLGFFSALAARRAWVAVLPVIITPVFIELIQALIPALDRVCNSQDLINNVTGGLLGVALGAIFVLAIQSRRRAA
ncbi:MAG TPA: VanZ family protein [Anaerolineales bacterium]|nr:VanZ family protein [Anaerolineales bacterium]